MLNGEKSKKNNGLGGEIVVTEAMIEAGVLVLARYDFDMAQGLGHDPSLVEDILKASLAKISPSSEMA